MRVAIQGEKGSFSHEAALRLGSQMEWDPLEIVPCAFSPEVFGQLESGSAEVAVIPIENSLAGSVLEHYDLLLAHPVRIEAELLVRIRHQLIAAQGVELSSVREVYSHPVALAQCRNFFAAHPHLRALPFYDTAGSAAHAVHTGGAVAGIASEHAARTYGGEVLLAGIEDHTANYTRFLLLRRGTEAPPAEFSADKVSLAFAVPNRPGSLVAALGIFARYGLNLTRLESRPVPGTPWEYVFYADYQLGSTRAADSALAELAAGCLFVKELGRYRAAPSLLPDCKQVPRYCLTTFSAELNRIQADRRRNMRAAGRTRLPAHHSSCPAGPDRKGARWNFTLHLSSAKNRPIVAS